MRLRNDRREERKRAGVKRNELWKTYSPAMQLLLLNERLGYGVGAKRQRAKLAGATS